MSMAAFPFDALGSFEKLKNVGFTEAQAKVQASALQTALNRHDEARRKELPTRGDLQDVRTEIQNVRTDLKEDIQDVRLEIEKVRKEIRETELRLIKWQLGIGAGIVSVVLTGFGAMVAIMAKSLGWSGF